MSCSIRLTNTRLSLDDLEKLASFAATSQVEVEELADGTQNVLVINRADAVEPTPLREIIARRDRARELVFDAIEANFGGEVASMVFTTPEFGRLLYSHEPLTIEHLRAIDVLARELAAQLPIDRASGAPPGRNVSDTGGRASRVRDA